ncbi:rhamnogalacturonan acetylesterase [Sphingomonas sp. 37zxx]|uniref:rhamnogalacturonan acetylesterase n=1 Tax=Sphingomonas sp. 37zxx TaxID=1550073 RepID=UPI001E51FB3A|nr:rhamnogalacturonan acetylesterase [Sphingomonas sp. 37zxx]
MPQRPDLPDPAARDFSVALAEGNYRVTLRIGAADRPAVTTVKAESRRLMLHQVATRAGEVIERSFVVNIRNDRLPPPPANAPGGQRVLLKAREAGSPSWDDRLSLEFLGDPAAAVIDIAPVEVPTLYLTGDSTVTDQRTEPAASWGQMLPALLDDRVAVANHAESGETLKSFVTELRLAKLLSQIKPGDYLFIQFGHNDQKANWPQTYADPEHAYSAYLRLYIAEARARGAMPVLVTSPERRSFEGDRIVSTLAEHVAAAKRVAAAEHVPLIDLNAVSVAVYEALGPDRAALAFNDGGADKTHHNNYGAWLLANAVAGEIRRAIPALAPHINAARFDPRHPPAPEAVAIAASAGSSAVRPAGN